MYSGYVTLNMSDGGWNLVFSLFLLGTLHLVMHGGPSGCHVTTQDSMIKQVLAHRQRIKFDGSQP